MAERRLIMLEDTNFIYNTNFSGDPDRDRFGSDVRKANIIIPSYDQAMQMIDEGFNVRQTNPAEGEEEGFTPTYYVSASLNYDTKWPPKVYLVSNNAEPKELDEQSVGILDKCYIKNVNAVLNPYYNARTGKKSLYVRTMYVEQDVSDDPFRGRYFNEQ